MVSKEKQRNSSIEFLRIIAMIGVIILHYNNAKGGGGFKYVDSGSIQEKYLFFSESLFICAVNLFVMISGYFLSTTTKRKFVKVITLLGQVVLFKTVFYFVDILLGNKIISFNGIIKCILPINYFVILYLVVYILSPYINVMIGSISAKKFKLLVYILFLLFSVWSIGVDFLEIIFGDMSGLRTLGPGAYGGYTIVNFILVYIIGAYIRLNDISLKKGKSIIGILVCIALLYFEKILEEAFYGTSLAWSYCNPIVILLPAFLILFFTKLEFHSKTINELAKATFTCYLFHNRFMPKLYVERFVNGNIFILILHQFGSAIFLYLISYLVYRIYYFVTKPIIKWITPKCDKIDISL